MGSSGDKPRKPRRRMAKVPRGAEASNIHLAGLANDSGSISSHRVDHDKAHGRSEDIGRFGRFFLRLLGRRTSKPEQEPDQEQS
jgi:hypothetical protein